MSAAADSDPVPVKNTFIHYGVDDEDDDEQPDYRRGSKSGPAFQSAFGLHAAAQRAAEEEGCGGAAGETLTLSRGPKTTERFARVDPAFVPLPVMPEEPASPAAPSLSPAPMAWLASCPEVPALPREAPAVAVKNTFIHYVDDDGEQPDYKPAKSGPAKLIGIAPEGPEEPLWVPLPDPGLTVGPPQMLVPSQLAAEPLAPAPAGALPSVGSAGHASGTCKACAHSWKPGGCSKGYGCTFCHICDEEDFKRRRKEKLNRLKAEKVRRRVLGDDEDQEHDEISSGCTSSSPGRGAGARQARQAAAGAAEAELAAGELVVEASGETSRVLWAVEQRRFRAAGRGLAQRLTLQLNGAQVPFVISFGPPDEPAAGEGWSRTPATSAYVSVQLKCCDEAALPGQRLLCGVRFAVGAQPYRTAARRHDFAAVPVCSLAPKDCSWDVGAPASAAQKVVIRAEVWPVPS